MGIETAKNPILNTTIQLKNTVITNRGLNTFGETAPAIGEYKVVSEDGNVCILCQSGEQQNGPNSLRLRDIVKYNQVGDSTPHTLVIEYNGSVTLRQGEPQNNIGFPI